MGKKKREEQKLLVLKLYNSGKIVTEETLEDFAYEKGKILTFENKYGTHKIDLESKTYEKNSEELLFKVDFMNNLGIIILNGDKKFNFAIASSFIQNKNKLELKYKLDEEVKIIIDLEEWLHERKDN